MKYLMICILLSTPFALAEETVGLGTLEAAVEAFSSQCAQDANLDSIAEVVEINGLRSYAVHDIYFTGGGQVTVTSIYFDNLKVGYHIDEVFCP